LNVLPAAAGLEAVVEVLEAALGSFGLKGGWPFLYLKKSMIKMIAPASTTSAATTMPAISPTLVSSCGAGRVLEMGATGAMQGDVALGPTR